MTDHNIRRFTAYRPRVSDFKNHTPDQMNDPEEIQYEGVVFSDGSCALRWRTAINSTSVWDSFEDAMRIHGHPEYGTRIVFHDEPIDLPWESLEDEEEEDREIEAICAILDAIFGSKGTVHTMSIEEFNKRFSD